MFRKYLANLAAISCVLLFFGTEQSSAYLINDFSPSSFDSNTLLMNSSLGLTGFSIEDFEDPTLISGLGITLIGGPIAGQVGPVTSNPPTSEFISQWDGNKSGYNFSGTFYSRVIFDLPSDVDSFGVGLVDFDGQFRSGTVSSPIFTPSVHSLKINGNTIITAIESLPNFVAGAQTRNLYLRIDAEIGDAPISTVEIEQLANAVNSIEQIGFDHLAYHDPTIQVSEPSTIVIFLFGLAGLGVMRRRKWCV